MEDLTELRTQYLDLINDRLPAAAVIRQFPIRLNHCFVRVILDNLFQGVWYDFLVRGSRLPAYKQLSAAQLLAAIDIATNILERDDDYIATLNDRSLQWRGKKVTRTLAVHP
jgi:hypothetical protein